MSVLWFDSALQVILTVNKGLSEDVLINLYVQVHWYKLQRDWNIGNRYWKHVSHL